MCKSTFKQEKFLAVVLCPMHSCKNYNVNLRVPQFYYFSIGVSPSPSDSQTAHLYSVKCQVLFKPISAYIELISLQHCLVICEQNHVQKTHWKFDYPFLPFIVS